MTLLDVARLRFAARRAGLTDITLQGSHVRFAPVVLPDSRVVRVQRLYPKTLLKPAVRTMLVPVPKSGASAGASAENRCATANCSRGARRLSVRYCPSRRFAV